MRNSIKAADVGKYMGTSFLVYKILYIIILHIHHTTKCKPCQEICIKFLHIKNPLVKARRLEDFICSIYHKEGDCHDDINS